MDTTVSRGRGWALPITLGVLVLCTALAWPYWRQARHHAPAERTAEVTSAAVQLPALGIVPDFQLDAAPSGIFDRRLLSGKVWIADFIFTQCPGVCPMLSAAMARLSKEFSHPDLRFVSFSVDPQNDTPEVLGRYAERYEADLQRWTFLTGDRARLRALVQDGFHLAVADRSPEAAQEDGQGLITHSDRFVLVDQNFQIRGYYSVSDAEAMQRLRQDLALLLAGLPGR